MGRPRVCEEDRKVTAVRLPTSLHERLHRSAGERGVSANELVTRAVEEYLGRLPPLEVVLGTQA